MPLRRWTLLLAALLVLASLCAAAWYAHLATADHLMGSNDSSNRIRNYYVDLWFCLLLAFLALQNFVIQCQHPLRTHGRTYVVLNNSYYVALSILFLEMSASWDAYGRADVAVWSALGIVASIANIYSLSSRNVGKTKRRRRRRSKKVLEPTSERTALMDLDEEEKDEYRQLWKKTGKEQEEEEEEESSANGKGVLLLRCCSTLNALSKLVALLVTIFLFSGAILHGMGAQRFPPADGDGAGNEGFVEINGVTVYYRCGGGRASSWNSSRAFPTVLIHGNPDQGVGDFLGLTNLLEEKGLRVCVWDRPGIGFSGYARPENLRSSSADLAGLMESLDSSSNPENGGPFFVVGYEKGGLDVLGAAAADEAGLVSEVLVVDTVTLDFMLRALVQAANMTESQAHFALEETLSAELSALNYLNALSVPLGLSRLLTSAKNTSSPEWPTISAKEQRWYQVTEKAWMARWAGVIREMQQLEQEEEEEEEDAARDVGIPVSVLISEGDANRECERLGGDAEKCRLMRLLAREKATLSGGGGAVIRCGDCGRDAFLYEHPGYTAGLIEQLLRGELDKDL